MIEITSINMKKIEGTNKCKAIVSIVINDAICINDIKIIEGQNGLFMAMPNRKKSNGDFKDVAHPINTETRELIQKTIIDKYKEID